jgi:hypothetical protein
MRLLPRHATGSLVGSTHSVEQLRAEVKCALTMRRLCGAAPRPLRASPRRAGPSAAVLRSGVSTSTRRWSCCEVCGNRSDLAITGSVYHPASFTACQDCINEGVEPYDILVTAARHHRRWLGDDGFCGVVTDVLLIVGREWEQFEADIAATSRTVMP